MAAIVYNLDNRLLKRNSTNEAINLEKKIKQMSYFKRNSRELAL